MTKHIPCSGGPQVTLDANGEGINPAWIVLRSEREDDAVALKILVNAIDRRFNTRRGLYFTDPGYGLDLEELLGFGITAGSIERLGLEMVEQVKEDERVADASIKSASKVYVGSDIFAMAALRVVNRIGEVFVLYTRANKEKVVVLKVERENGEELVLGRDRINKEACEA